jgi:hypothetical protein
MLEGKSLPELHPLFFPFVGNEDRDMLIELTYLNFLDLLQLPQSEHYRNYVLDEGLRSMLAGESTAKVKETV